MTEIFMDRFGSVRKKTVHTEKVQLIDGIHFKCHHNCPHNNNGICSCIILNDSIHVKYCFCG